MADTKDLRQLKLAQDIFAGSDAQSIFQVVGSFQVVYKVIYS